MKRGRMVLLNLLLGKLPVSDQGGTASEAPPLTPTRSGQESVVI